MQPSRSRPDSDRFPLHRFPLIGSRLIESTTASQPLLLKYGFRWDREFVIFQAEINDFSKNLQGVRIELLNPAIDLDQIPANPDEISH